MEGTILLVALTVVDAICTVVCFSRGRTGLGLIGLIGLFGFAPVVVWFPLYGALKRPDLVLDVVDADTTPVPRDDAGFAELARFSAISLFLGEARREGIIDVSSFHRLSAFLDDEPVADDQDVVAGEVATAIDEPVVEQPLHVRPLSPARHEVAPVETPRPAPPPEPGEFRQAWQRIWEAWSSEMAVHGFAYLGVLMTFVAVLGFLLFAFVDIPDSQQLVYELVIAVVFFAWGWFLRRQNAVHVAAGMELIGGMVLPLVAFASLVDNVSIPPDFTGRGLVVALTLTSLLLALAYSWYTRRRPASTLRYLVAPLVWLGALVAGFWFKTDELLTSDAITRLVSPQPALAAVAVAVTVALAVRHREHRLSVPTMRASLIGLPVAYLLTISLTVAQDWDRLWPLVVLAGATILVAETWAVWYDKKPLLDVVRPLIVAASLVTLAPGVDLAWLGLIAVLAYVVSFEYGLGGSRRITAGGVLSGAGAVIGGVIALGSPWPALLASMALAVWAHLRRNADWEEGIVGDGFDVLAAVAPLASGAALMEMLPDDVALVTMGIVLVAVTTTVRLTSSQDRFWPVWLTGAGAILAATAALAWSGDAVGLEASLVVGMAGLSVGLAPRWPVARIWGASAMGVGGLAMALESVGATGIEQAVVWAGLGLGLTGGSAVIRRGRAAQVAIIGHLIGLLAFQPIGRADVGLAVAWSAWAAGWVASTAAAESGGETVRRLVARLLARLGIGTTEERGAAWLAPVMAVLSIPPALIACARLVDGFSGEWTGVLVGLVALGYAGASRLWSLRRPLGQVSAVGAMVAAVVGASMSAPEAWQTIIACWLVIAVGGVIPAELRQTWFTWVSWTVTVPLAALLGERAGVPADQVDTLIFLWGSLLLIGGLLVDERLVGRRQAEQGVRTSWLLPAVVVGTAAFAVGLIPVLLEPGVATGWWAAAAALVSFGAALLMRIAPLSVVGYGLAAFAVVRIAALPVTEEPWVLVAIAAPLLGLSWLLERLQNQACTSWSSWDLPPLVVAHGLGIFALLLAFPDSVGVTWLALGLLSVVVSVWKRNRAWAEAGNLLVLVSALDTGLGWLSLALVATSLRGMVGTWLTDGSRRFSYQAIAITSAGLAWPTFLVWRGVEPPAALGLTAVVFGVVTAGTALLTTAGRLQRDTAMGWGGLGASGVLIASVVGLTRPEWLDSPALSVGLVLLAVALQIGAPTVEPLFRALVAPIGGLAWLAIIPGLGLTIDEAVRFTAIVFGMLATVSTQVFAMASNKQGRHEDPIALLVSRVWLVVAVLGVGLALVANTETDQDLAVAFGLILAGAGLIRGARPLELGWLRSVAMGAVIVALNYFAVSAGIGRDSFAVGLVSLGALSALASTSVWRRRASSVWVTPLLVLATLANLEAALWGLNALPDRTLLVAVLVSVGIQTLVVGLIRALPAVLAVAPVVLGLGFVLLVDEGIGGSTQWYTVPLGVVLLSEVEILRLWRRQTGSTVPDVQVMEWLGVGLLVVPGIVEMFTTRLVYGLVPFLAAGLLLVWATVTRVRRRAVGAAAVAIATSVLVLFAAAAGRTPDSASFWIIGFGAGLAVMLVAAFVEAYRTRRGRTMLRLHELMQGWE